MAHLKPYHCSHNHIAFLIHQGHKVEKEKYEEKEEEEKKEDEK